jgi:hypothetical protein
MLGSNSSPIFETLMRGRTRAQAGADPWADDLQGPYLADNREIRPLDETGSSSQFDKVAKKMMIKAGLVEKEKSDGTERQLTFPSFRHGAMTELGEAELTDNEIRHLSRHKNARLLKRYARHAVTDMISSGTGKTGSIIRSNVF